MQERDDRAPASAQYLHEGWRRDDDGSGPCWSRGSVDVAIGRPPQQLAAEHEERPIVSQDERAVGQRVERRLVQTMRVRTVDDPFRMELCVDRVGAGLGDC